MKAIEMRILMIMIPRGGVKKIQVYWDPKVRPIFENLNKGNKNDLTFFKDLNIYSFVQFL